MSKVEFLNKFKMGKGYIIYDENISTNIDETISKFKIIGVDVDDVGTRVIHLSISRYLPLCLTIAEFTHHNNLPPIDINCIIYEKLLDIFIYNLIEMGNAVDYVNEVVDWIHTISAIDKGYIKESIVRDTLIFYNNHNVTIGLEYREELDIVYTGILAKDLACIMIL